MMGTMVPETCWASNNICNKNHLLHLVGILFPPKKYVYLEEVDTVLLETLINVYQTTSTTLQKNVGASVTLGGEIDTLKIFWSS